MQKKVLVIEDSQTNMKVLKHLVERTQLEAICAASLVQARHIFSSSTPEEYLCAVVDYNLPDAPDGEAIDFTINAFIPTIVITGRLDQGTRDKVLAKEVVDYIPKENAQVYEYLSRLLVRLEKNKKIGVLIVDDSRVSRNAMQNLLRRHNFVTYEAADGKEGLDTIRKYRNIKLVITDENMPNMSGVEMVAELRRTYKKEDLSVIGISSDVSAALSARFIKSGANDYLHKPYCHEEFFCRIMQNVEHVENIEAIRRAANSDYLTGLPNRRHFFNRISASLRLSPAEKVLATIDIDHFKKLNDTYGHDGGDKILKDVARMIIKHFANFHTARFGGEEFCIFMTNTNLGDAVEKLESFRKELADTHFQFENQTIKTSISIGVTDQFDGQIESMLKIADRYLYLAKEQGRNRTVFADS